MIPTLDTRPEEVELVYRNRLREERDRLIGDELEEDADFSFDEEDSHVKSYANILKDATARRSYTPDTECSHPHWIQRCSLCRTIMASDMQTNTLPSTEPVKLIYNELDSLVCSYDSSISLQALGVKQQSFLYWIFYENKNSLTLRLRTNLPERADENALIASAFTSQELFKRLLKIPHSLRTNSLLNRLAWNGANPDYLAKLLCRCLRKVERAKARKIDLTTLA